MAQKSKQLSRSGAHKITKEILQIPAQINSTTDVAPIEFRIENLSSIPVKKGEPFAWEKSQWITGQFEDYLRQKARLTGHKITTVPSYYTSKLCAQCYREGKKGYLVKMTGKISRDTVSILPAPPLPQPIDPDLAAQIKRVSALNGSQWIHDTIENQDSYQQGTLKPSMRATLARQLNGQSPSLNFPVITFFPAQGGNILYCYHCGTVTDRDRNAAKNIAQHNRKHPLFYQEV